MSAPVALTLFEHLCALGNAMEVYRDQLAPCSDTWTALTEMLGMLDESIDLLVHSTGVGGDDDV